MQATLSFIGSRMMQFVKEGDKENNMFVLVQCEINGDIVKRKNPLICSCN